MPIRVKSNVYGVKTVNKMLVIIKKIKKNELFNHLVIKEVYEVIEIL
jgi:hypothetical protein